MAAFRLIPPPPDDSADPFLDLSPRAAYASLRPRKIDSNCPSVYPNRQVAKVVDGPREPRPLRVDPLPDYPLGGHLFRVPRLALGDRVSAAQERL